MSTSEAAPGLLRFFDAIRPWLAIGVAAVDRAPDPVLDAARERFAAMAEELPYRGQPRHVMASSIYGTAAMLAVFEVLREDGISAHTWGAALQELPTGPDAPTDERAMERMRREAEASQAGAAPNEFVFEMVEGDTPDGYGMNIRSCAVCHLFSGYGAMELVPYMCSLDDVASDAHGQGLRRTGTIALGATHCDFRFRKGGEPLRLAGQYPDRIRVGDPESAG